ncbi:MAG: linear amide C-N hydrolase [Bacteroidales bacterium]|nr:linear amide C-N hydrolase [Bacteroidales bacterium]
MRAIHSIFLTIAIALSCAQHSDACTRVVYIGDDGYAITGRNLDWKEDIATNLYVFPQGITRSGYDVADSTLTWTAKYGSVAAIGYDMGATEGMNEQGLVCNLLYLPGTSYSKPHDTRLLMSSSVWVHYVLDNFATTAEAVAQLKKDVFRIDAPQMPGGSSTTLHMAISDMHGYSAIIEYIDGELQIHEGYQYQVLTNAPPYDQQLAVEKYWSEVGGMHMLPGTNRSYDRFARASFYINAVPKNASHDMAIAGVFGVIFNCAVPVGISVPEQPEISSTRWRSVADQRKLTYYYGTTLNPSIMWVDLNDFILTPGAPIMKLDIINAKKAYGGNVIKDMVRSNGYSPLYRYK